MAKEHANKATNGDTTPPVENERRKDWVKIQTDRGVYSGERGKGAAVCGLMLGILDMPPVLGKPWQAIVIRLTESTKAKRGDQEYLAQPGDEILVPINHQLRTHLARAACNPKAIAEVYMKPIGQRKTTAGSMTEWDIQINPQLQARSASDRLLAMQAQAPALAAPGASGQGVDADDDIPF